MNANSVDEGEYSRFKGWNEETFGLYKRHEGAYYRKELAICTRLSGQPPRGPLRLLEVGFGNGAFLGWARAQGHAVCGIEIETTRLAAARRAGFAAAASLEELEKTCDINALDGLVAFDVFEHLSYPQLLDLLRRLRALLKDRGWIMARFPNGDSPFGRINQHGDITHVTALGSTAVRQLAAASRLEVMAVSSEALPFGGVGITRCAVNLARVAVRGAFELPFQVLLNTYYPGRPRWYPLAPNLIGRLIRP